LLPDLTEQGSDLIGKRQWQIKMVTVTRDQIFIESHPPNPSTKENKIACKFDDSRLIDSWNIAFIKRCISCVEVGVFEKVQ